MSAKEKNGKQFRTPMNNALNEGDGLRNSYESVYAFNDRKHSSFVTTSNLAHGNHIPNRRIRFKVLEIGFAAAIALAERFNSLALLI